LARWAWLCSPQQNRDPELQPQQQGVGRESLPAARRTFSRPLPHHQRQIESPQVNQHAFINIFLSAQVHTPHASRSTRQRGEIVREDPVLLELYVQLAESNLPSGSASV